MLHLFAFHFSANKQWLLQCTFQQTFEIKWSHESRSSTFKLNRHMTCLLAFFTENGWQAKFVNFTSKLQAEISYSVP